MSSVLFHIPISCLHFLNNFMYLFLAVLGLHCCVAFSLVVASGDYSQVQCTDFSSQWLFLLWSTGSRMLRLQ